MGISPFPGKEIGLFTFLHSLTILGVSYGFFHDVEGHLAVIPIKSADVDYYVAGQTYDLGVVTPG